MALHESWDALEADLLGDEPDWEQAPEPIEPSDLATANRLIGRLAHEQRIAAQNREVADAQIAQVRAWLARENETVAAREAWLGDALARWHQAILANDPKRKTVSLPAGTSKARKTADEWRVDEDLFLPWAIVNAPAVVRQKPAPAPEVDRQAMKKWLVVRDERDRVVRAGVEPETGETPPGLEVVAGVVEFNVIVGSDE